MNKSLLALAAAVALSAALPAAYADEIVSPFASHPIAEVPDASAAQPFQARQSDAALQDFRQNVNPNSNIPTTGIYDQEDRFTGPTGRPLPGWGSVNGEGAGDN
jgi:hypothetical protein